MTLVLDSCKGEGWSIYNADVFDAIGGVPDESIHYSIFSPPFSSLYTYSASDRDAGNVKDDRQFAEHFAYLVPQLFRVVKPGRLLSFHCMNLPTSKERDGYIGIRDFRGMLIRMFCGDEAAEMYETVKRLRERAKVAVVSGDADRCERLSLAAFEIERELKAHPASGGFIYHSEVCIWKNPVTAMQRTKAKGLLHMQLQKDSAASRQGIADYLVTMRKPGTNAEPVRHTDEGGPFTIEDGLPHAEMRKQTIRSINNWQQYASPVWMDIDQSDTLNGREARENDDERHVCPLQLQVIERAVDLWTNPGDVVLSPFAGIGSEGYVAVKKRRRFMGFELKGSYYEKAVQNLAIAEESLTPRQASLFAGA